MCSSDLEEMPRLSLGAAMRAKPSQPEILSVDRRLAHYRENLAEAERIAQTLRHESRVDSQRLAGDEGDLQFFQLPRISML